MSLNDRQPTAPTVLVFCVTVFTVYERIWWIPPNKAVLLKYSFVFKIRQWHSINTLIFEEFSNRVPSILAQLVIVFKFIYLLHTANITHYWRFNRIFNRELLLLSGYSKINNPLQSSLNLMTVLANNYQNDIKCTHCLLRLK